MCALCGLLGGQGHWTDPVQRDGVYIRATDAAERRRERRLRVAEANAIFQPFGLALEDWLGDSYILRGRTGRSEIVSEIAALWSTAEKMAGKAIDPLDLGNIERRERANG
jgi:hypothetical protein